MSGLSKRKHRQERAQGGNLAGLSEAFESAGYFTDFRRVASHRDRLAKNTPAIAEGA